MPSRPKQQQTPDIQDKRLYSGDVLLKNNLVNTFFERSHELLTAEVDDAKSPIEVMAQRAMRLLVDILMTEGGVSKQTIVTIIDALPESGDLADKDRERVARNDRIDRLYDELDDLNDQLETYPKSENLRELMRVRFAELRELQAEEASAMKAYFQRNLALPFEKADRLYRKTERMIRASKADENTSESDSAVQ